jgi:hypothetical protein
MPSAAALPVCADDLAVLRRWAGAALAPAVLVQRAKLLLLAAEGVANADRRAAGHLAADRDRWRKRYAHEGLTARLADRPHRGRPQTVRRHRAPRSWWSPSAHRPSGVA